MDISPKLVVPFRWAVYEVYGQSIPTSDTEFPDQFWFWLVLVHGSLFDIWTGQNVRKILRRHVLIKAYNCFVTVLLAFHVSQQYKRTDFTLELRVILYMLIIAHVDSDLRCITVFARALRPVIQGSWMQSVASTPFSKICCFRFPRPRFVPISPFHCLGRSKECIQPSHVVPCVLLGGGGRGLLGNLPAGTLP
jgi:hypothetical protein